MRPTLFLRQRLLPTLVGAVLLITSCNLNDRPSRGDADTWSFVTPPVERNPIQLDPLPLETVVYTEDESLVAQLEGSPGYRGTEIATSQERTLDPNEPFKTAIRNNWPEPTTQPTDDPVLLFQGLRRRPSGPDHEVFLAVGPWPIPLGVVRCVLFLGGTTPKDTPDLSNGVAMFPLLLVPGDRLTLCTGEADPDDSTRVAVTYDLNGYRGVIEGKLDEQGKLDMRIATGPARTVINYVVDPSWLKR